MIIYLYIIIIYIYPSYIHQESILSINPWQFSSRNRVVSTAPKGPGRSGRTQFISPIETTTTSKQFQADFQNRQSQKEYMFHILPEGSMDDPQKMGIVYIYMYIVCYIYICILYIYVCVLQLYPYIPNINKWDINNIYYFIAIVVNIWLMMNNVC